MLVGEQIRSSVLLAPVAIFKGKPGFFAALAVYLLAGIAVFGCFAWLLLANQDQLQQALMDYLLPASWHGISERLMHFFFETQTKTVLASMVISGSLVLSSLLLFPVKEWVSARYESESHFDNGEKSEFPLWLQGLEESKLLLVYICVQSVVFAIGYYPYEWCSWLSSTISVLFLCFSFGIDLIAPTFQRHRYGYSVILKLLSKNFILCLLFGALFTLPMLLIARFTIAADNLSLIEISSGLFILNLFFIAAAIPAGTQLASKLMPEIAATHTPAFANKLKFYGSVTVLALVSLSFHYLVAASMHHKSQILKCHYDIDWESINTEWPSWKDLSRGEKTANLSFDLNIYNPTPYNLDVEDSELQILQNGEIISNTHIKAFAVASGESLTQTMQFSTRLDTAGLSNLTGLLNGWSMQIKIYLLPGLPLILPLSN